MLYPEYCYVDFGDRSVAKRRILHINEVRQAVQDAGNFNCFRTWYRFPEAVQKAGTVKGYKGPVVADWLPLDFDSAEHPEEALLSARKVVGWLGAEFDLDPRNLRFFFSGMKGFHVVFPAALFGGFTPSEKLPHALKKVALDIAGDLEMDTAIYDPQRFLRIENTTHEKTGLYRIPLTATEFLNLSFDEIKEFAKAPRTVDTVNELVPIPALVALLQKHLTGEKTVELPRETTDELLQTGLKEGEGRDERAFKIACWLRNQGVKPTVALRFLELWDMQNDPPLTATDGENILQKKVGSAYGPQETDELTTSCIKNIQELGEEYTQYVLNLKQKRVLLGYPGVDEGLRGIAPGELAFIIAKANVGKSALVQNIQRKLCEAGQWSIFLSLEQPLPQCFERFAQMTLEQSGQVIEDLWQNAEDRIELLTKIQQRMSHALVVGRSLKVEDIQKVIQLAEQKVGEPISCVLIDYLGYLDMRGLGTKIYEQVSTAARNLKQVAKQTDKAFICVTQVSRAVGGDGSEPLTIEAARDSGAVEESGDFVLGLRREKDQPDPMKVYLELQVLKNRKGNTGATRLVLDRKSMRIEEA